MRYIHRDIEKKVIALSKSFSSLALTGPRQSGKSTLLMNILKDYTYVTFDDPLTREQALSDPLFFLDSLGEKVIIDEIQYAPGILSYIKMNIDKNRQKKGLYILTGSQQFNMIKNLGDSLAGRIALLDLLPFSIREKKKTVTLKNTLELFVHASLRGSYPELVVDKSIDAHAWYGSYTQTYLERDIRSIYNIGNLRDFQQFMRFLAGRCSQLLNMTEYAKALGVSVPTIKNWLSILEAGRIIYLLPPFYNNLGKRITKSPKMYFWDIGLVCYLTGIRDKAHMLQGPMAGALFENFCVQEVLKIFMNAGQRPRLYFVRTSNDLEVDLLIETGDQALIPVEVKLNKTPSSGMGANISRFRALFTGLNLQKGLIVSLTDKTVALSKDLEAITLDDLTVKIEKAIS